MLKKKPFVNNVGKEENADCQHFSPFPTILSILSKTETIVLAKFNLLSAHAFNADQFKSL